MDIPDEELYQAYLKQNEQEALRVLFERYREGLVLFLYGFTRSIEDAEELMLDTFAEVAAGPTVFSGKSCFRTWLFSIGKHLALMHLRKLRRQASEKTLPEDRSPLPENELLRDEHKRELYAALEKLPTDYRQVLTLLYIEEMSPAEVAQILNKRIKQVYNLTDRGKRALKQELLRMGFAYEDI